MSNIDKQRLPGYARTSFRKVSKRSSGQMRRVACRDHRTGLSITLTGINTADVAAFLPVRIIAAATAIWFFVWFGADDAMET